MNYALGVIAIVIAIISYSVYFRDIFKHKTKPHGVTWFIWGTLNLFIFYEQMAGGAGPGAWVTGAAAVANLAIFGFAFKYGERNITRLDWICLLIGLLALSLWLVNPGGVLSVILACMVFVIGFIPTLRKSFKHAEQETIITFALNSTKFLVALFALQTVSITTALYPAVLLAVNGFFASFLLYQRMSIRIKASAKS